MTYDRRRSGADATENGEIRLGALADLVSFHLRLAQEASYHAFLQRIAADEELAGLKLNPGHVAYIALIAENPGITQTALSRASGRDKSSLTPVVEELVRRGFVEKQRLFGDRRCHALMLTAAGEALRQALAVHAQAHSAELDRIVGHDNKAGLIDLLHRIAIDLR